jgi:Tol biopolymer transport system component
MAMWQWLSRLLLAVWFVGMVITVVWNGGGVQAEKAGVEALYLPLIKSEVYDPGLRDYVGLVQTASGYFTVRGDGSEWLSLGVSDAYLPSWSPDGNYLTYTDNSGAWMVSLATRDPVLVLSAAVESLLWSPNSRYVAYEITTNVPYTHPIYIFDVRDNTSRVLPLERNASGMTWAPNGEYLAWRVERENGTYEIWVWEGGDAMPQNVVTHNASTDSYEFFWSPDSSLLMYNNIISGEENGVFVTNATGVPASLVIRDRYIVGWVDEGARILLQDDIYPYSEKNVYLSNPDGTNQTLFTENIYRNVRIAPFGRHVYFTTEDRDIFVQATTSTSATLLEFGNCSYRYALAVQPEGSLVACYSPVGGFQTFFGTKIADSHSPDSPITPAITLPYHTNPRFLVGDTPYMATDEYSTRPSTYGSYPVLNQYENSYLFNLHTGVLKRIVYPDASQVPIIEWRYMP